MCIDDMNIESSARSSLICLAVTSVCYKSSVVKNKIEIYNLKLYISANWDALEKKVAISWNKVYTLALLPYNLLSNKGSIV